MCFVTGTSVDEVLNIGRPKGESVKGVFDLNDVVSFPQAFDAAHTMPPGEIRSIADRLFECHSTAGVGQHAVTALKEVARQPK